MGFKTVHGFLTVDVARREYHAYLAQLDAQNDAYTTEEFGDDYVTVFAVERRKEVSESESVR